MGGLSALIYIPPTCLVTLCNYGMTRSTAHVLTGALQRLAKDFALSGRVLLFLNVGQCHLQQLAGHLEKRKKIKNLPVISKIKRVDEKKRRLRSEVMKENGD